MHSVKFLLRCIKDGVIGILGGSPPQKSCILGLVIWFVYYLLVALIVVVTRSAQVTEKKWCIICFEPPQAMFCSCSEVHFWWILFGTYF